MIAAWRSSSTSSATIDIDTKRICLTRRLARDVERALDDVDGFTAGEPHAVHLHAKGGQRVVVAAFGDRECAVFVAERLDMLAERAMLLAGKPREKRDVVPIPYR